MGKRVGQIIVVILVVLVALYLFRADILKFVEGPNPSPTQKIIGQGIDFLASIFAKILELVKSAILYLVNLILKIVSNTKSIVGLLSGLLELVSKLVKTIFDLIVFIYAKVS